MTIGLANTQNTTELATLLVPVHGKQLVLPNVTVAEIIPYTEPEPLTDSPAWLLGEIQWREIRVPVVSFELLNEDKPASQPRRRRIAVLNGLLDDHRLPFCAMVTEGVPRLMRVMADEVIADDSARAAVAELRRVIVSGEKAVIPNLDYIQQQVLDALSK